MAEKRKNMDQNRRDAMYWAQEWQFKQKRRRIFIWIGAVAAIIVIGFLINYISILGSRKTFDGTISYYHVKFTKTDEPAPEPIDPSTLKNYNGDSAEEGSTDGPESVPGIEEGSDPLSDDSLSEEEKEALETEQKSLEETQEAAEKAGVLPEGETDAT